MSNIEDPIECWEENCYAKDSLIHKHKGCTEERGKERGKKEKRASKSFKLHIKMKQCIQDDFV